eukprot:jgi/Psemu1/31570/gm1.31570_g
MNNMIRALFLLSVAKFSLAVSAETDGAIATDQIATDLNYSVDVYECGEDLRELSEHQQKEFGSVYRVCFEPNQAAKDAGVAIKTLDSWEWSTSLQTGLVVQPAVVDGNATIGLSVFECLENGKKCYLDSIFGLNFYENQLSVQGRGEASMTFGTSTVPVNLNLFWVPFSVNFKDGDGNELSADETLELLGTIKEHNDAVKQEKENSEDVKSVEDGRDEL